MLAIIIAGCTTPAPTESGVATYDSLQLEWYPSHSAVAFYALPWTLDEGRPNHDVEPGIDPWYDMRIDWRVRPDAWAMVVYAQGADGLELEGAVASAWSTRDTTTLAGNESIDLAPAASAVLLLNRNPSVTTDAGEYFQSSDETWPRANAGRPLWLLLAASGGQEPTIRRGDAMSHLSPPTLKVEAEDRGKGFMLSACGLVVRGTEFPVSERTCTGSFAHETTALVHHPVTAANRQETFSLSHPPGVIGHFEMARWNGAAVTTTERLVGQLVGHNVDIGSTQQPVADADYYGDYWSHVRASGAGATDVDIEIERIGTTRFAFEGWWLLTIQADLEVDMPFHAAWEHTTSP